MLIEPEPPKVQLPVKSETRKSVEWRDTSNYEKRHDLKPEPYSLDSNESDPELLGPQSTLKNNPLAKKEDETVISGVAEESELYSEDLDTPTSEKENGQSVKSMSRSRCIDMIGLSKFNEYSKKYGGESAAIDRCIILSGRRN